MRRADIPFETGQRLSCYIFVSCLYLTLVFLVRSPQRDFPQATIKKDIKMEEAEELKAKLEGIGATVEIV